MAKEEHDIIVCRCEDVTLGEIRKAIREGATTLDEVKRITRAGMGPCQGRTCRLLVAGEIARYLGKPVSEILQSRYRPPVKPVKMGDLSVISEEGENSGCKCREEVTGQ
ncbi:MAG TPA: (2Fe-2S)-binding protein [Firmicutes bacterium]|nr:(2Fe-2S)-binding protein [Candidatus Fermentithermobacillaceae bacterium]